MDDAGLADHLLTLTTRNTFSYILKKDTITGNLDFKEFQEGSLLQAIEIHGKVIGGIRRNIKRLQLHPVQP